MFKKFFDLLQCALGANLLHDVAAQNTCDKEAHGSADHGGNEGQDAALPPAEEVGIGEGDEESGQRGCQRLEDHQQRGNDHRIGAILGDEGTHCREVTGLEHLDDVSIEAAAQTISFPGLNPA